MEATFLVDKFWEDFKAARQRRNLSQEKVGEEFGVGGSAISQWENQKRTPSAVKFLCLCKAFDLSPSDYISVKTQPFWHQPRLPLVDDALLYGAMNMTTLERMQQASDLDANMATSEPDDEDYDPAMRRLFENRTETVYRTASEIERFDRLDLDADAPVGYHREQADIWDYYAGDREAGY